MTVLTQEGFRSEETEYATRDMHVMADSPTEAIQLARGRIADRPYLNKWPLVRIWAYSFENGYHVTAQFVPPAPIDYQI